MSPAYMQQRIRKVNDHRFTSNIKFTMLYAALSFFFYIFLSALKAISQRVFENYKHVHTDLFTEMLLSDCTSMSSSRFSILYTRKIVVCKSIHTGFNVLHCKLAFYWNSKELLQ